MDEILLLAFRAFLAGVAASLIYCVIFFVLFQIVEVTAARRKLVYTDWFFWGSFWVSIPFTFFVWRLTPLATFVQEPGLVWLAWLGAAGGLSLIFWNIARVHRPTTKSAANGGSPAKDSLPSAKYLAWPIPLVLIGSIASVIGAYAGGGGSPRGVGVALAVNPLLWVAIYAVFKVGKLQCPHCRRGRPSLKHRNAAAGTPIHCDKCGNWFAKPSA
jgi:hypothetical protein